jgi:two-component system, OmpR family, response regulator MprA
VRDSVLIVEDDASTLEMLTEALQDEGCRVTGAASGRTALVALARCRPDAILLDWQLGDTDAGAFADAYRALPGPHAPIVLTTATLQPHERERRAGAAAVVAKPFELDALLDALRPHLDCLAGPATAPPSA